MSNQEIQLNVSFNTTEKISLQDKELEKILANVKPARNLAEYARTLTFTEDPLTFQENIR